MQRTNRPVQYAVPNCHQTCNPNQQPAQEDGHSTSTTIIIGTLLYWMAVAQRNLQSFPLIKHCNLTLASSHEMLNPFPVITLWVLPCNCINYNDYDDDDPLTLVNSQSHHRFTLQSPPEANSPQPISGLTPYHPPCHWWAAYRRLCQLRTNTVLLHLGIRTAILLLLPLDLVPIPRWHCVIRGIRNWTRTSLPCAYLHVNRRCDHVASISHSLPLALPQFPWMQMFSRTRHWTLLGQKHCNNEIITTDGIPLWDNPWLTSFHSCWLTQLRQSNDLRTTTKNEQEQHNNKHEQKLLLPQLFLLLNTSYFVPGDD